MIEIVAVIVRWVQLAANMILIGSSIFLVISIYNKAVVSTPWLIRLERLLPWIAGVLVIGLLALLAVSSSLATGVIGHAWQPSAWYEFLIKTRTGHIWMWREGFAILTLGIAFIIRNSHLNRAQWRYILCSIFAIVTLSLGSLGSHAAAEEMSVTSILPYTLHIVLAGAWFGALPAFLLIIFTKKKGQVSQKIDQLGIQTLKRFSIIALPIMLGIIATGVIVADRAVDTLYGALVATEYGWLLITKVILLIFILVIASRARSIWLPALSQGQDLIAMGTQNLRKWVRVEFVIAGVIILLATILANTIPAKHSLIEEWPYPFRFSIDATWEDPSVQTQVLLGASLFLFAVGIIIFGKIKKWALLRSIGVSGVVILSSFAVMLPPIAVQAYPETYRNTPVPFDSISIAKGAGYFAENCVVCHGPQGKGNGVLAKSFTKPPADLLTEPHTERHTAGDFFNWLSKGIPDTGMPGFEAKLDEEGRWDVVNYIHAMSRGYQARLMSPKVIPDDPSTGPPNFSYTAHDGSHGILQDFRYNKSVLLVLFSWPESRERLAQLRAQYYKVEEGGTEVLAVPMHSLNSESLAEITEEIPFPVVTQGAKEITQSYILYRRTLGRPDLLGEGAIPNHLEFLVDRFGYLRARWIPVADAGGWSNMRLLMKQIVQLKQEKEILPPPDDMVH
ncbi:MAG: cytochrome C [Nitrosomonadaceae bacterium]|nr:cytochrome C [Nitrosomonadaceae bacterium]|tara:strand:- start:9493 stop:11520 length:2028 start_codon:yes stop_codon:yes gene_type:complete